MDGENNGTPYEQMDYLGVLFFWKHPYGKTKQNPTQTELSFYKHFNKNTQRKTHQKHV